MRQFQQHPRHVTKRKPSFLVVRGRRICFSSEDRSLAEAYYHGQKPGTVVLMSADLMLGTLGGLQESNA